ncbi:hypothetical protein MLD38_004857 [Melastoma candidum]|uniref:Uncharacterized protein n=1 Tax=Melastoma candidum TaxID=119954 RepID=A0ACB9SBY5_9MYRT|nr:hypothetical protein MLD38_004857 [Melastoma candidum]
MERFARGGNPSKTCHRSEENEEGNSALELTLGPPGCKKKGNLGTRHFLSLATTTTTTPTTTCPSPYLKEEKEEDGGESSIVPPPLPTAVQKSQKSPSAFCWALTKLLDNDSGVLRLLSPVGLLYGRTGETL